MSVVGNNRVGIPIVLLHDAEGAVITVETKKGELIRGLLFEAGKLYVVVRPAHLSWSKYLYLNKQSIMTRGHDELVHKEVCCSRPQAGREEKCGANVCAGLRDNIYRSARNA